MTHTSWSIGEAAPHKLRRPFGAAVDKDDRLRIADFPRLTQRRAVPNPDRFDADPATDWQFEYAQYLAEQSRARSLGGSL